jgi:hypothetical protein
MHLVSFINFCSAIGFSKQTVALLNEQNVKYSTFDILTDEDVRQGKYFTCELRGTKGLKYLVSRQNAVKLLKLELPVCN